MMAPGYPHSARTLPLLQVGAALLGLVLTSRTVHAQGSHPILDSVRLELTGVEDSSTYLLYQYRVLNPASSRGGVAGVELDLSARPGTGHEVLPFTGARGPARRDVPDHVPFGAIAPDRWQTLIDYKARLVWYVYEALLREGTAPVSFDSVGPGDSKTGFAVRSPYIPGIRQFTAIPTEQSCCTKPNAQGELPSSFFFRVGGAAVAPTYAPGTVTPQLLRELLERACSEFAWISPRPVCATLTNKLASGPRRPGDGDQGIGDAQLRAFLAELEVQHEPGKSVNDNAYWLLKVNAEYVLGHR